MTIPLPVYSERQLNEFAKKEWEKTLAFLRKQFGLSDDECKDIFQEAFIVLHRNNTEGKLGNMTSSLSTYFNGICRNKAYETLRRNGKSVHVEDEVSLDILNAEIQADMIDALKAHGYKKIFFDYDSIQKGEFTKRIIDAIYSCKDFILVLSPKSMKRCTKKGDPVANEIRTALKYNKHIIPVTIDGKEPKWPWKCPEEILQIQEKQYHNHRSDSFFEHSIDELCEKLTCKKS